MLKLFVFKYRIINYFPLVLSFLFFYLSYRIFIVVSYLSYYFYLSYFYRTLFLFYYFIFFGGSSPFAQLEFQPNDSPRSRHVSNDGSSAKAGPILEPSPHDSLFSFSSFEPTESQPNLHGFFFHVACPSETSSCLPQVHATLRPAIPSHVLLHSCYVQCGTQLELVMLRPRLEVRSKP